MNTTIHPLASNRRQPAIVRTSPDVFRQPAYECEEHRDAVKLVVYVPGVAASGVDIEGRGADLTVTARKARFVRVNWPALQLENVQRDYRLRLRLGTGFDFAAMEAEITGGVLIVTVPKRVALLPPSRLQHVA